MTRLYCPRCGEYENTREYPVGFSRRGNPLDTRERCRRCGLPAGRDPSEPYRGTFHGGDA